MKKPTLRARLRYWFDNVMAKGALPLILLLLAITVAVVLLIGVVSYLINGQVFGSLGNSIWQNLMHALDAGTLAGLDTASGAPFVALMTITTICGIFITSMLIGIINSGLESKFDSLRKGNSRVLEKDHTVILGFDSRVFIVLRELTLANENRKKPRIVILGDADKEEMDQAIRDQLPDTKNTVIITRTGDAADAAALSRCSLETCRSIIINESSDAAAIRTILAVTNYMKEHPGSNAHITAVVYDEANVEVARIAGEGRAEIIYFADAMARIIAHTCRQPGLSMVYTELFSFEGNEIYMEPIPAFAGLTFSDIQTRLPRSCPIGINRGGQALVNPPMDTVILDTDEVIVVADDDGMSTPCEPGAINTALMAPERAAAAETPDSLLVLGHNALLGGLIEELDRYVCPGSRATVACDSADVLNDVSGLRAGLKNTVLRTELCDICDREVLESFAREGYGNIVVLSDPDIDPEEADATTLMVLLHLRDIAKKTGREFSVTSEMRDVRNQELAKVANVNDFVVSSNLTSLITSQISEDRLLASVFADLLDEEGSEIYLKRARDYVTTDQSVDFFTVARAAAAKGEVFIGYKDITRTPDGMKVDIRLNPAKTDTITFDDDDLIIVIAED